MRRQWYLDALRIIAIAAVVVIHAAGSYWIALDVDTSGWALANVFDGLARWAVPVFVMISGALFLDPAKPQPIRKLFSKNVLRIATVALFWGFVYAIVTEMTVGLADETLVGFVRRWLLGHYHMWFLYMIAGLYVLVPILRCITASKLAMRYFLIIAFVANSVIPFLTSFGHFSLLGQLFSKTLLNLPIGYSFYFVLGYWINSTDFSRVFRKLIYSLGIVGAATTVGLTYALSHFTGEGVETYYGYLSLPVCLASVAVFLLAKSLGERLKNQKGGGHPVLLLLSSSTLGVYMVHILILEALHNIGIGPSGLGPFIGIPLSAILTIVISYGVAAVMTKIPFFGKHFV